MNIKGTLGGKGIRKFNLFLILLIWALLTVNTAASKPEGMIIKNGILTYPASSYHAKEPISLYINNCGDDNKASTLKESYSYFKLEKEDLSPSVGKDHEQISREVSIKNLRTLLLESITNLDI